jgi:hypothetical protein
VRRGKRRFELTGLWITDWYFGLGLRSSIFARADSPLLPTNSHLVCRSQKAVSGGGLDEVSDDTVPKLCLYTCQKLMYASFLPEEISILEILPCTESICHSCHVVNELGMLDILIPTSSKFFHSSSPFRRTGGRAVLVVCRKHSAIDGDEINCVRASSIRDVSTEGDVDFDGAQVSGSKE